VGAPAVGLDDQAVLGPGEVVRAGLTAPRSVAYRVDAAMKSVPPAGVASELDGVRVETDLSHRQDAVLARRQGGDFCICAGKPGHIPG
jgi:hypothetical protein